MSGNIEYKEPADPNVKLAGHEETVSEQTVKMPIVKMAFGVEGGAVPVSTASPFPVQGTVAIFGTPSVEVVNTLQVRDADLQGGADFISSATFTAQTQVLDLYPQAKHKKIRVGIFNESDADIPLSLAIKGIGPVYETAGVRTILVPAGACESLYFDGMPVEMRLSIDLGWAPTSGACSVQVYGWK